MQRGTFTNLVYRGSRVLANMIGLLPAALSSLPSLLIVAQRRFSSLSFLPCPTCLLTATWWQPIQEGGSFQLQTKEMKVILFLKYHIQILIFNFPFLVVIVGVC